MDITEIRKIRGAGKKELKEFYKKVYNKLKEHSEIIKDKKKFLSIEFENHLIMGYTTWDWDEILGKKCLSIYGCGALTEEGRIVGDIGKVIIILKDLYNWFSDIEYNIDSEIRQQEYIKACLEIGDI